MPGLSLQISDYLRATCPNLRLGAVVGSTPSSDTAGHQAGSGSLLDAALDDLVAAIAADPGALQHPRLEAMAATFRRAGANPSRYAPSATALVKRIAAGKGLYRINPLVDINNLLSLTLRIPCGIYDREHIAGPRLTFDLAAPQATYLGIDGVEQRTAGKLLLADRDKVLGGPHADAAPTRITDVTRHFLCVLYYPDMPESPVVVAEELGFAARLFEQQGGAVVLGTSVAG
ncbi:MAG TPA: phenylalanine--tRNA ligase beta subunit-related protein [bacterium]|nr:phenylalanine--tRNA ligase beta subunit-related protein [bacterium]